MAKSTELATIDSSAIAEIEKVAAESGLASIQNLGQLARGISMAAAIHRLRSLVTPEMVAHAMALMNTPLGFKTDRDPARAQNATPYSEAVVKDCLIQSLLIGLYPVNNEWNIIAGNMYVALNGVKRLVESWPGVSNVRLVVHVHQPSSDNSFAFVPVSCYWHQSGESKELHLTKTADADTRLVVRVNAGMGPDAIAGKARRKAYVRVLELLSQFKIDDADASEVPQLTDQKPRQLQSSIDAEFEEDARSTLREASK